MYCSFIGEDEFCRRKTQSERRNDKMSQDEVMQLYEVEAEMIEIEERKKKLEEQKKALHVRVTQPAPAAETQFLSREQFEQLLKLFDDRWSERFRGYEEKIKEQESEMKQISINHQKMENEYRKQIEGLQNQAGPSASAFDNASVLAAINEIREAVNVIKKSQEKQEGAIMSIEHRLEQLERIKFAQTYAEPLIVSREETGNKLAQRVEKLEEKLAHQGQSAVPFASLHITSIEDRLNSLDIVPKVENIKRRLHQIADLENSKRLYAAKKYSGPLNLQAFGHDSKTILVAGGAKNGWNSDEIMILSEDRSFWKSSWVKLPCKNSYGGLVCLNDQIYIFGGAVLKNKTYKLTNQMKWIPLEPMNQSRDNVSNSSLVFDRCIWVFGGYDHPERLKSVEKFDPLRNAWIPMPKMREARQNAAAVVYLNKMLVCGGFNGEETLSSVECFDPQSDIWTMFEEMPTPLCGHSAVSIRGGFIIIGGREGTDFFCSVWEKFGDSRWTKGPSMTHSCSGFTAVSIGTQIFAIGGWAGNQELQRVEILDDSGWRYGPRLPNGADGISSVVISQNLAASFCSF